MGGDLPKTEDVKMVATQVKRIGSFITQVTFAKYQHAKKFESNCEIQTTLLYILSISTIYEGARLEVEAIEKTGAESTWQTNASI